MNWLRTKLRAWLGMEGFLTYSEFIAYQEGQQQLIEALQGQLTEFKQALKARAAQSPAVRVNVMDFETAQVAALEQFREKEK